MEQQAPTIVVVDDEAPEARGFIRSLEASGCRVVHLLGADEASAYFSQEQPKADAVILELMVPPGKRLLPRRMLRMPVPMAILTRADGAETLRLVHQAIDRHPSAIVRIWFKKNTDPKSFASEFTTWLAAVRDLGPPEA